MKVRFLPFLVVFVSASLFVFSQKKLPESTAADLSKGVPSLYAYPSTPPHNGFKVTSQYLTMRDGVKLAVDVYMPKGAKKGDKFPVILHQTRYWREVDVRWPFKWFVKTPFGLMGEIARKFTANGYVLVNVDVRGSGASFGKNLHPWSEDEVKDGYEICDWIVKQAWSTGSIGTAGASYTGTASEFLLTMNHPAVKADVNMYSLFDVYADNAFPGGIHNVWFTRIWGNANHNLDNNRLPTTSKKAKMVIRGVKPVGGAKGRKLIKAAVAEHQDNLNVNDGAMKMNFRDEEPIQNVSADKFSPHAFLHREIKSNVPVYSYSGWSDGCYQNAAVKRYLSLHGPKHKLMIGPWEHGGSFCTSPNAQGKSGFDHAGELLKFMDYHVKGLNNALPNDAPVHYFTQIENKWKSARQWPPAGLSQQVWAFNGNTLLPASSTTAADAKTITYRVDTTATTGKFTRWESLAGQLHTPFVYTDRAEQDKKLAVFDSPPLAEDLEITGHAIAELMVKSSVGDCSFFVYLEEVLPDGKVRYITEGQLRSLCRTVSDKPAYCHVGNWRSFASCDAKPLDTTRFEQVTIDLYPTSYLVQKGNQLRVAIGGHDAEHFRLMNPSPATWEFLTGGNQACKLYLPIMGKSTGNK